MNTKEAKRGARVYDIPFAFTTVVENTSVDLKNYYLSAFSFFTYTYLVCSRCTGDDSKRSRAAFSDAEIPPVVQCCGRRSGDSGIFIMVGRKGT